VWESFLFVFFFSLLLLQTLWFFFARSPWNRVIFWNSIGTKILLLILVFSLLQGWFFMVDVVLILMVLNVGGALIVSRFLTRK